MQWSKNRDGFVKDGITVEESYLSSSPKLLFVLKEVNDPDGGDWDLREFVRSGARSQTWDNIVRWIIGIRNIDQDFDWKKLENISEEDRKNQLQSIGAINIKKSPGGHTSENSSLWAVAMEDKDYFKKQFSLYDPDIVICCGSVVKDIFCELIKFSPDTQWVMSKRGVLFHEYQKRKFIVQYSHPEARVANNLLYYGLVDAIREFYK